MIFNNLTNYQLILASKSPRRQELLSHLNLPFTVLIKEEVEENYPSSLPIEEVPLFLALLKAKPYHSDLSTHPYLVITADTIVVCDHTILGKPNNRDEAIKMLQFLSGKTHQVITGAALTAHNKQVTLSCTTSVSFKHLTNDEITYYVDTYKPYDKAGGYGIQEWIGMVAIERIDGSYYNVVGLPVQKLHQALINF